MLNGIDCRSIAISEQTLNVTTAVAADSIFLNGDARFLIPELRSFNEAPGFDSCPRVSLLKNIAAVALPETEKWLLKLKVGKIVPPGLSLC